MADNVLLSAPVGSGDTIAADDDGTAKHQYVKIEYGGDGTFTKVTASVGLPVADAGGSLTVDAPVGTPVFVRLSDGSSAIATLPVSIAASVAVTGTFWQATQPVSIASVPSHAVTNVGVFATQIDGDALTSLQLLDNAISGAGFNITQLGGVNVTMGNGASGTGVQRVTIANDSTGILAGVTTVTTVTTVGAVTAITNALPAGTNAIGKLAANSGVDIGDVDVTSIAAGDNNIGNVDIVTVPSDPFGVNADAASATGSISAKLRFIAATGIPITGTVTVAAHAVTNAGVFVTQENGALLTAAQLLDDTVFVDDAAFTTATSKVLAVGFQADETATDSVDEGDIGCPRMTLDRKVHVTAELESNAMRAGGVSCTPKFAVIDHATSGDNTIVAAVASKKIRVLQVIMIAGGTVNVRFESGAGGTALSGQMQLTAQNGFNSGFCPVGHFETASNTLLNLELSGAVSVDGWLVYVEV